MTDPDGTQREGRTGPLRDVRDISRIAYGFIGSQALFAALELDLFSVLSGGGKPLDEIARLTGVPADRLATLLSALASLGLLDSSAGRFTNAPASERYLVRGAPGDFGDYYRYQIGRQVYPSVEKRYRGVRGEPNAAVEGFFGGVLDDPAEADAFTRAQHAGSTGPAVALARRLQLGDRRTLLDVAGGSGAFSIALCEANPNLHATVLDFPNVVQVAERFVTESHLAHRISCVAGNAFEVAWPASDIVLMSYLLSAVAPAEGELLIDRAFDALPVGGMVIIHDFLLDEDRAGPTLAALWFLQYLGYQRACSSFTGGDIERLLSRRGFVDVSSGSLIPEVTGAIVGHKPG